MEELESRRLLTTFIDTPIEVPTQSTLADFNGREAIYIPDFGQTNPPGGVLNVATGQYHSLSVPSDLAALEEYGTASVGNKTLFAGGYHFLSLPAPDTAVVNSVYIYDDDTGLFSNAAISVARSEIRTATVGTKAIFAGGLLEGPGANQVESDAVDIYDDATGAWSTARLTTAGTLLDLLSAVGGNKAYFAAYPVLDRVDVYDSEAGTWSTISLPSPLGAAGSMTVVGSKVVVLGSAEYYPNDQVAEIYDNGTQTWTTDFLGDNRITSTVVDGNQAYFTIDRSSNQPARKMLSFDATTGNWISVRTPKTIPPSQDLALNHRLYFVEDDDFTDPGVVDVYDTLAGNWSKTYLSVANGNGTPVAVGDQIYIYGLHNFADIGDNRFDVLTLVPDNTKALPNVLSPGQGVSAQYVSEITWSSVPGASSYSVYLNGKRFRNPPYPGYRQAGGRANSLTLSSEFITYRGQGLPTAGHYTVRIVAHVGKSSIRGPLSEFTVP